MTYRPGELQALRTFATKLTIAVPLAISLCSGGQAESAPVAFSEQHPTSVVKLPDGGYLLDFGRVAFGNLLLNPSSGTRQEVTVRFGESMREGRVDRTPPGSVRYSEIKVVLDGHPVVAAPRANSRNSKPPAVPTPAEMGVLTPFRWVEISGWSGDFNANSVVRRAAFDSTWDDQAASFDSSDPMLNRVWDLCHYTIKATTFAGIFVDGDRERLAYEADAYLNQLGYYAGDPNSQMERDTFDRLVQYPTWPTEWAPHMVFMAYADWMQTADKHVLAKHYDWLKTKLLTDRVAPDGLVHSTALQMAKGDIVDWPTGERDGYVFTPVNTVVNAFHLRALAEMIELARVLGKEDDAKAFSQHWNSDLASFQRTLFDPQTDLYIDGVGTNHSSLHANLFPLAFGLVPESKRVHIAEWLAQRGMRASPYAAQYLLAGLFQNGQAAAAVNEITAPGDRSWRHMVDSGTTITWEAWDQRYKSNQDWNHAWGAAPANLLPHFVLGVRVLKAGWMEAEIEPHPSGLQFAKGTVPTPRGPIQISWKRSPTFTLSAELPAGMKAEVRLPATADSHGISKDGKRVPAHRQGDWWILDEEIHGKVALELY